jgi:hypothetical protein
MDVLRVFREEAFKVIDRGSRRKRICRSNALFSQENILTCALTRGTRLT